MIGWRRFDFNQFTLAYSCISKSCMLPMMSITRRSSLDRTKRICVRMCKKFVQMRRILFGLSGGFGQAFCFQNSSAGK
jgi:hypothetical protein